MSRIYAFEKLQVWQSAMDFSLKIYAITGNFPTEERFGITSQIRRSSSSVSSNIAEGSARVSPKDKARFYQIAYSSLIESVDHLIRSHRLSYLDHASYQAHRLMVDQIAYKLNALYCSEIRKVKQSKRKLEDGTMLPEKLG